MDEFEIELRRKRLLIACAVVVTVALVVLCVVLALSRREPQPTQPTNPTGTVATPTTQPPDHPGETMETLVIQQIEEQGSMIVVTTNYGTVAYPVAFEALMSVEARNQENDVALEFYATIDGKQCALYALAFHSREGIPVGYLQVGENVYAVNAIFHEPVGLDADGKSTFYAAQETFNDVVTSLEDNTGFSKEKP